MNRTQVSIRQQLYRLSICSSYWKRPSLLACAAGVMKRIRHCPLNTFRSHFLHLLGQLAFTCGMTHASAHRAFLLTTFLALHVLTLLTFASNPPPPPLSHLYHSVACLSQGGKTKYLRGDHAKGSKHSPSGMQHLNLPVALEGLGICAEAGCVLHISCHQA